MNTTVALKESASSPDTPKNVTADNADNDNLDSNVKIQSENLMASAHQAAWKLIQYKQQGREIKKVRARGKPEDVQRDLERQLLELCDNAKIAREASEALVEEAIVRSDAYRSKVRAEYIGVSVIVADMFDKSMYQFDDGHAEITVIEKNNAETVGSSIQQMRLTATGTATTSSNRTDVDKVFASIKKWGVYLVFEETNKEKMDGLEAEAQAAIAAIAADMAAGEMDAQGLREAIERLEDLGALTPEIGNMLTTLMMMSDLAAMPQTADTEATLKRLSEILMKQIGEALKGTDIPANLLLGMAEYLNTLSESYDLGDIIQQDMLRNLIQDIKIDILKTDLKDLSEALDGDAKAEIEEMIKKLGELEGAELAQFLNELGNQLQGMDLPADFAAEKLQTLIENINDVKTTLISSLPLDQRTALLSELSAQDMMDLLEKLDTLDPAVQQALSALGIENMADISSARQALAELSALDVSAAELKSAMSDPKPDTAGAPASAMGKIDQGTLHDRGDTTRISTMATGAGAGAGASAGSDAPQKIAATPAVAVTDSTPAKQNISPAKTEMAASTTQPNNTQAEISSPQKSAPAATQTNMAQENTIRNPVADTARPNITQNNNAPSSPATPSVTSATQSNVVDLQTGTPAKLEPIVQQLGALADTIRHDGTVPGTQQLPPSIKVIAESIETGQNLATKLVNGEPLTAADATAKLMQLDTAINNLPDGAEKTQLIAVREKLAQEVKDIPGMDPDLIKDISRGSCYPVCDCDATQDAKKFAPTSEEIQKKYSKAEIDAYGGEERLAEKIAEIYERVDADIIAELGERETMKLVEAENRSAEERSKLSPAERALEEASQSKVGGAEQDAIILKRMEEMERLEAKKDPPENTKEEFNRGGCPEHGENCPGHNSDTMAQPEQEMSFNRASLGSQEGENNKTESEFKGKKRVRRSRAPEAKVA